MVLGGSSGIFWMLGPSMFGVGGTAHNSNMGLPVDCNLKAGAPLCRPNDDVVSL